MEIYVYTKTPRAGMREWKGIMRGNQRGQRGGRVADCVGKNKWWTDLALEEGIVRRCSVWFREPNLQRAIELLSEKNIDMAIDYMGKSINAYQRTNL